MIKNQLEQKQLTLKYKTDKSEHHYVFADKMMVETIIRNLLSNAIKFSYPNGIIELNVSESESEKQYQISIIDHGIGIKPEIKMKLFTLGNRSSSGTMGETGIGLGLRICKDLTEFNHGKISVLSESGQGSTFSFTLDKFINQK